MGINRVVDGITDMESIVVACRREISKRILRYQVEVENGIEEVQTVDAVREILGKFDAVYKVTTNK